MALCMICTTWPVTGDTCFVHVDDVRHHATCPQLPARAMKRTCSFCKKSQGQIVGFMISLEDETAGVCTDCFFEIGAQFAKGFDIPREQLFVRLSGLHDEIVEAYKKAVQARIQADPGDIVTVTSPKLPD